MQISALLGVSVPTYFINDGSRNNKAVAASKQSQFQQKGVLAALVGARFEKPTKMEAEHMLITADCTEAAGYGQHAPSDCPNATLLQLWAQLHSCGAADPFYHFPSYAEVSALSQEERDALGLQLLDSEERYFNTAVYKRRLRFSIQPFLIDGNRRAAEAGTSAYVHCIGLGLGAWKLSSCQAELMLQVYQEVLQEACLPCISDIHFAFQCEPCLAGCNHGDVFSAANGNQVRVHFGRRNVAAKLAGEHAHKLLIGMYDWDSNAYPGNEYWSNLLSTSSDSSAACCSTICQLQNPEINPHVSSASLFVCDIDYVAGAAAEKQGRGRHGKASKGGLFSFL